MTRPPARPLAPTSSPPPLPSVDVMVAPPPNYEGAIVRHRKRIMELEGEIKRYSMQIRRLKSRSVAAAAQQQQRAAAAAAAAAHAAAAHALPMPTPTAARGSDGAGSGAGGDEDRAGKTRYWTEMEHNQFLYAGRLFGPKNYVAISQYVGTRTPKQVRTHAQKYQMKLEREARKRSAHAAAVAAAGAPAAAVAAATAACEQQRVSALAPFGAHTPNEAAAWHAAAASAFMANFAVYPAAAHSALHHPVPHAYAAQVAHAMRVAGAPHVATMAAPPATPTVPKSESVVTGESGDVSSGANSSRTSCATVAQAVEPATALFSALESSPDGLEYLRDTACSPVSNDSSNSDVLMMVDEKGGVVKSMAAAHTRANSSSVGNLADYDEFMRKVGDGSNTFGDSESDVDLEILTSPVRTDQFEQSLLNEM